MISNSLYIRNYHTAEYNYLLISVVSLMWKKCVGLYFIVSHLELKEVIQRCIPFFSYSIYKILHGLSDNVFRKREPQFEFSKTQKKRNKNGLNLEMLPSPVFIEESDLKPSNATIMMKWRTRQTPIQPTADTYRTVYTKSVRSFL